MGAFNPQPKFEYVRSKRLRAACCCIPCQACDIDDGTVVGAHSNQARHGKGRSIKASDIYIASLCHHCHYEIDQGSTYTAEERQLIWQSAHVRTVARLVREGRWPPGVPIPPSDPIDPPGHPLRYPRTTRRRVRQQPRKRSMSTIITPTVGRKVWYRPSVAELAVRDPMKVIDGQPLDATVIAVHDDRLVNLLVIDAEGNGFPRLNVQLVQEDDVYVTDGARAEWMPYQTAQAAKAAATEEGAAA